MPGHPRATGMKTCPGRAMVERPGSGGCVGAGLLRGVVPVRLGDEGELAQFGGDQGEAGLFEAGDVELDADGVGGGEFGDDAPR